MNIFQSLRDKVFKSTKIGDGTDEGLTTKESSTLDKYSFTGSLEFRPVAMPTENALLEQACQKIHMENLRKIKAAAQVWYQSGNVDFRTAAQERVRKNYTATDGLLQKLESSMLGPRDLSEITPSLYKKVACRDCDKVYSLSMPSDSEDDSFRCPACKGNDPTAYKTKN